MMVQRKLIALKNLPSDVVYCALKVWLCYLKAFRLPGGGRHVIAPEFRDELFSLFIDIRHSLKARFPKWLFKAMAEEMYDIYLKQQPEAVPADKKLLFSDCWLKAWMIEYQVSLLHPNKRFAISQKDRIERVLEIFKNLMISRKFFIDNHGYDPEIINADQGGLDLSYRNEGIR